MIFPTIQNYTEIPGLTGEQKERQAIADTLKSVIDIKLQKEKTSRYYYSTSFIDVKQLAVTLTSGSDFDKVHWTAKNSLRRMIAQPSFLAIVEQHSVPEGYWVLVSDEGDIFAAHEKQEAFGAYVERINMSVAVNAALSLKTELSLLTKVAMLCGGIVSSNDRIALLNWCRFQGLDIPVNTAQVENLIAFLNFKLPAVPAFGNYWGLSSETHQASLIVPESEQSVIYQELYKLLSKGDHRKESLINYLAKALLRDKTETFLREYPGASWRLLIETEEAKTFAQTCSGALNLQGFTTSDAITVQQRSQLLVAAILMDLSLGRDDKNRSFYEFHLYRASNVQANVYEVRQALAKTLESRGVSEASAPLARELILAGLAPEFLVDAPRTLQIGSTGWVLLRKSVMLAESVAPGLSRNMTYSKLLEFGAITPTSAEQKVLHDLIALRCMTDWAVVNELELEDAESLPAEEVVKNAVEQYNAHLDTLTESLKALTAVPLSRRQLAKQELIDEGVNPHEMLYVDPDRSSARLSIVDVYLNNDLRSKDWDRKTGRSLYEEHPGLATLDPINQRYKAGVTQQFESYKTGINTVVRLALSQLPERDRLAIEFGLLAGYYMRDSKPVPFSGGIARRSKSNTAFYGVVVLARYAGSTHCYELFPLQGLCRKSQELAQSYIQGATLDDNGVWFTQGPNGRVGDFEALTFLGDAIVDVPAYFQGGQPTQGMDQKTIGALLERFGAYDDLSDSAPFRRSPMQSFNSQRFNQIGNLVAEHNPPMTYEQFYAMGYDKTALGERDESLKKVVDAILDIVIPFKGCIEGLASGDPERRSGAIFSCVMDATAIVLVFAGAAGAFAKAATTSSKLLNLSKVGARFVVSVFNPLEGVPQLVGDSVSLVGRSALKLGHYGQSVIKGGAGQLRRLADSSGSYDLIKALHKTGSAAEIRMTLPTVAHARALLRDDSIQTAEQVLNRLGDKKVRLPGDASDVELEHLFNHSVIEASLKLQGVRDLEALIGRSALDDLLTTFMTQNKYVSGYAAARSANGAAGYPDILEAFARIESTNIAHMDTYQKALLKKDLGKAPFDEVLPDSVFNPQGFTDDAQRAGAWIVHASTSSGNNLESIVAILREYAGNGRSLTDPVLIKALHAQVAPASAGIVRVRFDGQAYASSISGFAALQQHLKRLDAGHEHFGKHLLGAVAGFHGLGDGNGRTARALYAISELRANRFVATPPHVDKLLHGLP